MNNIRRWAGLLSGAFLGAISIAVLLFSIPALPDPIESTFNLTWKNPTTRQNGTPLPADQINRTNIRYRVDGGPWIWGGNTGSGTVEEFTLIVINEPGEYEFVANTVTTDDLVSPDSNIAINEVPPMPSFPPNQPAELSVERLN